MLRYLLHVGLRKGVRVSTEETPREAVVGSHCFLMLTSHHLSVSLSSDPPESIRKGESHHSHFTDGKPAAQRADWPGLPQLAGTLLFLMKTKTSGGHGQSVCLAVSSSKKEKDTFKLES